MDSDRVLVLECLALGVDSHDAEAGRVERVDAVLRCGARMRGLAHVADELGQEAVGRVAEVESGLGRLRLRVHHHGDVDVVEVADLDQFLLAAQVGDLASVGQPEPVLDLQELLGRRAEEVDLAGERARHTRAHQADGGAQHARHLDVVAALVRGAGDGVAHGRVSSHHRIELAHDADGRPLGRALEHAVDAGDGQALAHRQAQPGKRVTHHFRGLDLFVAQLGVVEHGLGDADDVIAAPVDFGAHSLLQASGAGFFVGHELSPYDDAIR